MTLAGFPHSGTPGSTPTCGSPRLFAACRALLRLSVPRHPSCALRSLDRIFPLVPKDEAGAGPPIPRIDTQVGALAPSLDASQQQHPIPLPEFSINQDRGVLETERRLASLLSVPRGTYSRLQKGGDPAAGSPTATLLRLRPSHRARLRPLRPLARFGHGLRALPAPMA